MLEIGTKLYEPASKWRGVREYTIVKAGRKWYSLNTGDRCSIDTLMRDCGGYSPQKLYTSIDGYLAACELKAAWSDLCRDMQLSKIKDGMTVATINEIRRTVGLEVFEDRVKAIQGE